MQFIEWSVIGLRSARHVFTHPESDTTVTIFPMIHVAAASFYDAVYTDAASHDVVVCEGLKSPVARRLTRAYRWIPLWSPNRCRFPTITGDGFNAAQHEQRPVHTSGPKPVTHCVRNSCRFLISRTKALLWSPIPRHHGRTRSQPTGAVELKAAETMVA